MENDMKQFNLQEYLENPSRQVVTRDGRKVRIVCTDFDNPDFPVIGEIKGNKWPLSFATNGLLIKGAEHIDDLFFAPEKHEGWVNILSCPNGNFISHTRIFKSKEDAEKTGRDCSNYITTIKIEWEE